MVEAAALRGEDGALREALAGLDPEPARRLPGAPGPVRPRGADHLARRARSRRRDLHLPRGHTHPHRVARAAQARLRAAGAREWRGGPPGRGAGDRARSQRDPHPPAQGQDPGRARAHLPPDRRPLAAARELGRRPDLARDRAAVGVARRPAAAAQGSRDRRRQLGHGRRCAARSRRARGSARLPHLGPGRGDEPQPRQRALPAGRPSARWAHRQARLRDRARGHGPRLPRRPVEGSARRRRLDRRPGRRAHLGADAEQGTGRADGGPALGVRPRARASARDRLPRRAGSREGVGLGDRGARPRQRRPRPPRTARRGLRRSRPGLRAHHRRHRRRDGRASPRTPPRSRQPRPSLTA